MFNHILQQVYLGNTLENWVISLLIIIGALIINKIIKSLNKGLIQRITSKTKNRLDDILFKMLEAPVLLGTMLIAIWIASTRLELGEGVSAAISKAYEILIVLNSTWFFARLINALIEEYWLPNEGATSGKRIDARLIPMVRRFIMIVIWTIGIVMALNNAGIKVGALLGTLGVGGLAVALAAQDTVKNILGGITIFTDQPFRIGDRIKVNEIDGIVEDIGLRSTRIRTLEKRLVTIPNYKIIDASIENITNEPKRKVIVKLGLTYDTTPEKMEEAISILKEMPKMVAHVDKKELAAVFSEFSNSSLVITFAYFITKGGDPMETSSKVNMEILRLYNEAGLHFAFPTQTIHIEKSN